MGKTSSLKDIANALNVSKTTVSWVLAGKGEERKISKDMQERVLMMAKRLNYEQNVIARSLSLGYTKTLGFIVSNISNIFYAELAQAVEQKANEFGYNIIICNSGDNPQRERQLIKMLKSKRVDGIILSSTKQDKTEILKLKREGFPLVLVDRYFPELDLNSVTVDNFDGAYRLVRYMIDKGSRKIGILSTASHLLTMNSRLGGYKKALNEAGIRLSGKWVKTVDLYHIDTEIEAAIDDLLSPPNMVEAVFCTTHFLAMKVYSYVKRKGLKIPNSLGVACFDYFEYFDALDPALTAVRQPIEKIGQEAVGLLLEQIDDSSSCRQIVLPTELVIGKSC